MKSARYGFALFVLFIFYYLIPIDARLLWQPDETRYAEISREMLVSGDWVVPHFLGLRYFEKPISGYWINSIGQMLFGHSNFAVRSGAIFSTGLTVLMVMWLTQHIWRDGKSALFAGTIYLTLFLVYSVGTYAVLDPIVTLWLVAAMCSFWCAAQAKTTARKAGGYFLLGAACGLGVMTKGFLALAVPVLSVLPWVIIQKRWKEVLIFGWLAVVSCALIVLPWGLAIAQREPDLWRYFFWVEHIQRFAQSDAQHKAPFWFYLPVIAAGALPWLGLLPGALRHGWREKANGGAGLYLLGWTVMPFLFFSIGKGKLLTYILPCMAPLAILIAQYAVGAGDKCWRALRINAGINVCFGLTGIIAALIVSPWGLLEDPLWDGDELYKVLNAVIAFLIWAVVGGLTLQQCKKRWGWAALCPLGLALLIGFMIPDRVVNSEQPQLLAETYRDALKESQFVLTNNVGVASTLAWELERSDITLFDQVGELKYGLNYPDGEGRFVAKTDFTQWLAEHRKYDTVALVILFSKDERIENSTLPKPDCIYVQGRLAYFQYLPHALKGVAC